MSEIYNAEYYKEYDVGCGKVDYSDSEYTKGFLTQIAQKIADDLHPRTVLDAGCAMGHLVAALRDLGVEAYGVDISKYAISKVREDIRPFCKVGSLTEPLPAGLPDRYDLVVTVEVLEHLYEDEGRQAIRNLCQLTDKVLFTSTPDDFTEPTHVNVQQREYWCRAFFENGFMDDINYRPTYLTAHALLFRRSANIERQVEDYERNIRISECARQQESARWNKAVEDKERHIQNITALHAAENAEWANKQNEWLQEKQQREAAAAAEIAQMQQTLRSKEAECEARTNALLTELTSYKEQCHETAERCEALEADLAHRETQYHAASEQCKELSAELAHYKEHYQAAIGQREALKVQLADSQYAYSVISNAFFWKITKPFRVCLDALKRICGKVAFFRLLGKGLRCLHQNGWRYTWRKVKNKLTHRQEFTALANKPLFTDEELEHQRNTVFPRSIKFSIVVPLYNTPEKFLHEMIRSVIDQTYANWELCMADGSDAAHDSVEKICRQYMRKDPRIKYRRLEQNLGISGNTNACLEMAAGDYIGLFDHDDLLHPAALHEVMRAICEQDADFIYTDENTFHEKPEDAFCPHFKPDYAPDTLRSYNYICHFTVFSKALLDEVGTFRGEFDGSQDYDMVLRLTEKAARIVHIPEILYFWRAHSGSVADGISAKPYTLDAARRALREHLDRVGLVGEVEDSSIPSTYRIKYAISGCPKVSIVIPNMDYVDTLRTCISSILEKTTYKNFEIVIIENNSKERETFAYYDELKSDPRIQVVTWTGKFNYSAINNFGIREAAAGEYILLLNNDIEVITPDWIQEMLMFAQRSDVGAVGAMLYYPDDTIQHAGVILGIGGVAGHAHKNFPRGDYGYMSRATIAQDFSVVTAACVMVPRHVWQEIGGLDETFEVAFNDVDMCMRIRKAGYLIVWTPFAELYHYESKSRGAEDTPEKRKRFEGEVRRFQERWGRELAAGDPYYNPNLTLVTEDFSVKKENE